MKYVTMFVVTVGVYLAGSLAMTDAAEAQTPTRILVRVTANDAKIIGSGVGGARITIRDAATGELLAEGVQEGSTGDTGLIMGSRDRGAKVFDTEGAAGFLAEIALSQPTRVLITGEGPLNTPHAMQATARSLLLVPGRHVVGEGVILELLGFTVELLSPEGGAELEAGRPVQVRGRITMLCGCPTEPEGIWDSSEYEILVQAVRGGEVIGEWPMEFADRTSHYAGSISIDEPGEVELRLLAIDADKANFGMATTVVRVLD